MSDTRNVTPAASAGTEDDDYEPPTGWVGWILFAFVIMLIVGSFQAIMGFVSLFKPGFYLVDRNGLPVPVDYTVWGAVHLVLGGLTFAAALGLLIGQTWARVVAVILAVVVAIVNLGFIDAYPFWITTLIVLDVFIIYALVVHGREMKAYRHRFEDSEEGLPTAVRPRTTSGMEVFPR
jgi:hypothetical protein